MKKLMSAVLMLFILTMLVSGASASAPQRNNDHYSSSVSGYSNAYATPSSENGHAALTSTTYASAGTDMNGAFATGYTQTSVYGGSGTVVNSGQTVSFEISP